MIKLEILNPPTLSTQIASRGSFASNTIQRYSRFRAKLDKKENTPLKPHKNVISKNVPKGQKVAKTPGSKRPKSLDSHIYANIAVAVDKKTLVQRWIDKTQSDIYTGKRVIKNHASKYPTDLS